MTRRRKGCDCPGDGSFGGHTRFTHFWQRMTARALVIELTYFHGNDTDESKKDIEVSVPSWIWRPRCWAKGHVDDSYQSCVYCRKALSRES